MLSCCHCLTFTSYSLPLACQLTSSDNTKGVVICLFYCHPYDPYPSSSLNHHLLCTLEFLPVTFKFLVIHLLSVGPSDTGPVSKHGNISAAQPAFALLVANINSLRYSPITLPCASLQLPVLAMAWFHISRLHGLLHGIYKHPVSQVSVLIVWPYSPCPYCGLHGFAGGLPLLCMHHSSGVSSPCYSYSLLSHALLYTLTPLVLVCIIYSCHHVLGCPC